MEPFFLVPESVYFNRSLNTHGITEQEHPKYQAEQNSTYQFDSFKEKMNMKLFVTAHSSVAKLLTSKYWGLEFANFFGWCKHWSFTVKICSASSSEKCKSFRHLLDFFWRSYYIYYISDSASKSECQSQRQRKRSFSQNVNVRGCKNFPHKVRLLMGLCKTK